MRSNPQDPTHPPGPDDVLSLFEPERGDSGSTLESPPAAASSARETPRSFEPSGQSPQTPASSSAIPVAGDPGSISLDRLVESAAPLRFVDGVALVQSLGATLKGKAGINAGMPDGRGVFLTPAGEFVVLTPPTGEPAARELARLLHRLVPSESTPPVGRLFVDRWSTGSSTDLSEFSSELGYFARPNGRDLVKAIHARCSGSSDAPAAPAIHTAPALPVIPPAVAPSPFRAEVERTPEPIRAEPERAMPPDTPHVSWLQSHRRHMFAAAALVVATVAATGLLTWFSPSPGAQAAEPASTVTTADTDSVSSPALDDAAADKPQAATGDPRDIPLRTSGSQPVRNARPAATRVSAGSPSANSLDAAASTPLSSGGPIPSGAFASAAGTAAGPAASLPSRGLPDMRIYSASDSDIAPPKLRSTEIVEGLIEGFDTRTNQVEVIVSQSGDVERVRMLGPPQRIPDVMLLSRVKEWSFEPAVKDGAAVRYRLVLSWNVTP